ncbi:hypothetical protein PSR33_10445 (plasmid) [Latilactobacillus curvatus]|uniref:Uncharacterized protein n=1 Tax=Latilactobacillus curvatus TaxID=28038 RepID=A0AAJ5URC8_LATCU|nr:hypothetical protein [Latilactobacillus curvatus]WDC93204.1 hypothetical protein PSR33_10445 [Latilactobacillus curvatus]
MRKWLRTKYANLFVSRAIKLAEKEERFALAADMVSLMGYNQHQSVNCKAN